MELSQFVTAKTNREMELNIMMMDIPLDVKLPTLPEVVFLSEPHANNNPVTIGIEKLSDSQLQFLGEAWTEALIKHAAARRKGTK